jgi:dUTP pyrophosphatase
MNLWSWLGIRILKSNLKVKIRKLNENATIPSYSKDGDAGMDLTATKMGFDEYGNVVYYTGLAMEIPKGYVGYIFPRSSVSKITLNLANSVGVIDSGYRGEIICKFKPTLQYTNNGVGVYINGVTINRDVVLGEEPQYIYDEFYNVGDRIAQIIIMPLPKVTFKEVSELSETERGDGGFGSSG